MQVYDDSLEGLICIWMMITLCSRSSSTRRREYKPRGGEGRKLIWGTLCVLLSSRCWTLGMLLLPRQKPRVIRCCRQMRWYWPPTQQKDRRTRGILTNFCWTLCTWSKLSLTTLTVTYVLWLPAVWLLWCEEITIWIFLFDLLLFIVVVNHELMPSHVLVVVDMFARTVDPCDCDNDTGDGE